MNQSRDVREAAETELSDDLLVIRTRAEHDAVVSAAWMGHAVEVVFDELEITG
jgi:hypothetical protein